MFLFSHCFLPVQMCIQSELYRGDASLAVFFCLFVCLFVFLLQYTRKTEVLIGRQSNANDLNMPKQSETGRKGLGWVE